MTKPFDPTKPVQTRDGRPARIICTDRKEVEKAYPIIVLVSDRSGREYVGFRAEDGSSHGFGRNPADDLVNVPKQMKLYLNVYRDGTTTSNWSIESANNCAGCYRTSLAEITVEDGEIISVKTVWKRGES